MSLVRLTGKSLSKVEQCSDWKSEKLSKSQIHYAAMDAYVLIEIYEKLKRTPGFEQELHTDSVQIGR